MNEVIYDDYLCRIELVPAVLTTGAYWVVLDGDDETAVWANDLDDARDTAELMRDNFAEQNGLSGVGS
jgi:hypothetical protein